MLGNGPIVNEAPSGRPVGAGRSLTRKYLVTGAGLPIVIYL
jgi:hypothetical protein